MQGRFKFRVWYRNKKYFAYNAQNGIATTDGKFTFNKSLGSFCESPDKYIVEQCTGLKDKNGKLIYEGDIVEATDGSEIKGRVIYDSIFGVYMTKLLENNQGIALEQYVDLDTLKLKLKVIGNIHEKPELLEEK